MLTDTVSLYPVLHFINGNWLHTAGGNPSVGQAAQEGDNNNKYSQLLYATEIVLSSSHVSLL